jgi:pimeloyl-ACP methyl ester carboxylesterase
MDHVGWSAAHLVGHSYGALVVSQMAIDFPERVASLAVLEPAVRGVALSEHAVSALRGSVAAYRGGDTAAAMDLFLRSVCGDDYRVVLDRVLPDAFDDAVGEGDVFFEAEMPAVQQWTFDPSGERRASQPVLNVLGTESLRRFAEASELVQAWFPQAERIRVPDAGHLMMVQNATAVAEALDDFFSRHPIGRVA